MADHPSQQDSFLEKAAQPDDFKQLGDYRIVREIGRGGMGVVFEAIQISLRRRVALKVLPLAGLLDERLLQRFRNEAQAAAGLHHPHIVSIYGVGCERGVHYYAMQFVEGMSLDRVISCLRGAFLDSTAVLPDRKTSGPDSPTEPNISAGPGTGTTTANTPSSGLLLLSSETHKDRAEFYNRVARMGIQASDALQYAHDLGIVHRDIKPGNLLLDENGKLWVTDFGLARIEGQNNLTMTGDFLGTLRYMSPEQAIGDRLAVDHRTDIYSLGATLYELIARRPVIAGTRREQLLEDFTRNDPRPLRHHDPQVPIDLEKIVLKSLSKEPKERYQSAGELAADLRRFLANEPTKARPLTIHQRAGRWARRNRTLVRSLAAARAICFLTMTVSAAFIVNERKNTEIARLAIRADAATAELGRSVLRTNDYISRIHLARRAIQNGSPEQADGFLNACLPGPDESDLRGFEWYYLSRISQVRGQEIGRHQERGWGITVSPDGQLYCSSARDGARVWDATTGKQQFHVTQHEGGVNTSEFSPDGQLLVTTSNDGAVRIWSTSDWSLVRTLAHSAPVLWAGFLGNGDRFAVLERHADEQGDDKNASNILEMWDTKTWSVLGRKSYQQGWIESGDITDDGNLTALGNSAGDVHVWDLSSETLRHTFRPVPDAAKPHVGIRSIDFAHHHPWLATVNAIGTARIWDFTNWSLKFEIRLPLTAAGAVDKIVFSPDDRLLAASFPDRCFVYLVDENIAPELIWQFQSSQSSRSLAFADSETLLAIGNRGILHRFRLALGDAPRRVPFDNSQGTATVQFSPDNQFVVTSGESILSYDLKSLFEPAHVMSTGFKVNSVAWTPDGRQLLAAGAESNPDGSKVGKIAAFDASTWKPMRLTPPLLNPVHGIQFLLSSRLLVDCDNARGKQWFEYPTWKPLEWPFGDMSIKGDGNLDWFVGYPGPRQIACFDARGKRWDRSLPGSLDIQSIAIEPRGDFIAVGRSDGTIAFCRPLSGDIESSFVATDVRIEHLVYAADGRTLAGWTADRHLRLWNVLTGRELLELPLSSLKAVTSIALSSDNRILAVAGLDFSDHPQVLTYGPFSSVGNHVAEPSGQYAN